jgi:acyl-CoA synthetase (AMP-forming)/AMP-acid ligase II
MNIAQILHAHARAAPLQPAIIDTRYGRCRRTTFAQLDEQAARAAGLLWELGLRPGDAVLVFQPMSAELYVALAALFRLGLVGTFLDPAAGLEHVERCCALNRPKAFIGCSTAHLLRLRSGAVRAIPRKLVIGPPLPGAVAWSRAARTPPYPDILACDPSSPALLTFTSGSTGAPRAIVRSHGFLLAQDRVLAEILELRPGEIDLATLPIVLLANLASRVTSVIANADLRRPDAIRAGPVIAQIREHQISRAAASPAFFERLMSYCAERRITLPSLRKLFSGGAPVLPRLLHQMQATAPHAEVVSVYGSTEAEPIAHIACGDMQPKDFQAMAEGRGLLAGKPVAAVQLRILRDQWGSAVGPYTEAKFAAECLPPGQAGEIVVSGPHVLTGYLHGDGDRETKFRVGETIWHRTGDAGYLDECNRLWLLGRCAARVTDRHGVLYPLGAEMVACQDPRVRRAALGNHAGRRVLALESNSWWWLPNLLELTRRLAWAEIDELRMYRRLPVDARHNAKIDYPRLVRLLQKRPSLHVVLRGTSAFPCKPL